MSNTHLQIHKSLTVNQIRNLRNVFYNKKDRSLSINELKVVLTAYTKVVFEENEFRILFDKINTSGNGLVTWFEFLNYLSICMKTDIRVEEPTLVNFPIFKKPIVLANRHPRAIINCIKMFVQVDSNRVADYSQACYITMSKDGLINYWSLNLKIKSSHISTSTDLKKTPTWVLCMECIPDLGVICISGNECDLRFFNKKSTLFSLCVHIKSFTSAITCMNYIFSKNIDEENKLLLGDMDGNVHILLFSAKKNPFKNKLGFVTGIKYSEIEKVLPIRVIQFKNLHFEWVQQIQWYQLLNLCVSCANSNRSVVMKSLTDLKGTHVFEVPTGVKCFTISEEEPFLVTGSLDGHLRIWNPYITTSPTQKLHAHHSSIVAVVLQSVDLVLTLSLENVIKIWNLRKFHCIQTYNDLSNIFAPTDDLCIFYNSENRQVLFGGHKLVVLYLRPLPSGDHTDGSSHLSPISALLYNPLYDVLVSIGLAGNVIIWNIWKNERVNIIEKTHAKMICGKMVSVPVTAATFDPKFHLLCTGANDGTIKIWNFFTGTCLKSYYIEEGSEVRHLCWLEGRLLAMGWNKIVTEFFVSGDLTNLNIRKNWCCIHAQEILSAATKHNEYLATASIDGEIVLWNLETEIPYRKYKVEEPTTFVPFYCKIHRAQQYESASKLKRRSKMTSKGSLRLERLKSEVTQTTNVETRKSVAVSLLFLEARPLHMNIGTLLVGITDNIVQIYSHHPRGRFLESFDISENSGEYVACMTTDEKNEFLFTGSTLGYIQIYLIKNYHSGTNEEIDYSYYKNYFPYLKFKEDLETVPIQLSKYRGHITLISKIIYLDKNEILITSSADFSIRLWTLKGHYIATLGTFKHWTPLDRLGPVSDTFPFTVPADLKRSSSETTLKVFQSYKIQTRKVEKEEIYSEKTKSLIRTPSVLTFPKILGNHFKLPKITTRNYDIKLNSQSNLYQHIMLHDLKPLRLKGREYSEAKLDILSKSMLK